MDIRCYIVNQLPEDMFPEPGLWKDNASGDASVLASLFDLPYPPQWQTGAAALESCTVALLKAGSTEAISALFKDLWFSKPTLETQVLSEGHKKQLVDNLSRLVKKGHYQSAMLWYGGEWYWGADRLWHLEHRLLALGAGKHTQALYQQSYQQRDLSYYSNSRPNSSEDISKKDSVVLYFSIRSPYSYLALEQALEFRACFNMKLVLKPILPMVMRGLKVPENKKMYIFHDTKREALRLGIPYGKVADPLGEGVENCYALYDYALGQGREMELMLAFSRAVNSEGVHGDSEAGLRVICQRAGLDWEQARQALKKETWKDWAEQNRQELLARGLWGVPCFSHENTIVWGQDRLWVIAQQLTNRSPIIREDIEKE